MAQGKAVTAYALDYWPLSLAALLLDDLPEIWFAISDDIIGSGWKQHTSLVTGDREILPVGYVGPPGGWTGGHPILNYR